MIEEKEQALFVTFKIQPSASKNQIAGWLEDVIKVRLKAPPVDGKANAMLIDYLAKNLKMRKSKIKIVAGLTSKNKRVRLEGITRKEFLNKLDL